MTFTLQTQQELPVQSADQLEPGLPGAPCLGPEAPQRAKQINSAWKDSSGARLVPPLLCLCGTTAALGPSTKETPSGHSLEPPAQLRDWSRSESCSTQCCEDGGAGRLLPTAGHTQLLPGARGHPKAHSDPKQGSFSGESAVVPETTVLHGQGEHFQQTAQSSLCKLLATCTIFTHVSGENEQHYALQQALGNRGTQR